MINWRQLAMNLQSKQRSDEWIARRVGTNRSRIFNMRHGKSGEPTFELGLKLLNLHYDHCPDKHKQIGRGM